MWRHAFPKTPLQESCRRLQAQKKSWPSDAFPIHTTDPCLRTDSCAYVASTAAAVMLAAEGGTCCFCKYNPNTIINPDAEFSCFGVYDRSFVQGSHSTLHRAPRRAAARRRHRRCLCSRFPRRRPQPPPPAHPSPLGEGMSVSPFVFAAGSTWASLRRSRSPPCLSPRPR